MRIRAIIKAAAFHLLCFAPVCPAPSQDYASWIQYTDSSDNRLVIEIIEQDDLCTAMDAAAALGLREDAQIEEIILAVGGAADRRPRWERELILRGMLGSVFSSSMDSSELQSRLRANRRGIDFLVANLPGYTLSLKREVIRLLGYLHPAEYLSVLMSEGRRLAQLLKQQEGRLNGEQAGLAITYLDTIGRIGEPEFADIALLMLERSRHLEVAQKARSVSGMLLLGR
jgi:hypothetical protein